MDMNVSMHMRADDEIEAKQTESPTRGSVGLVTVDAIPLFPASAEQCFELATAFIAAAAHFPDHVRPMGVRELDENVSTMELDENVSTMDLMRRCGYFDKERNES